MKFALGALVATPAALRFCTLNQIDLLHLVQRHASGDWGDVSREDAIENDLSVVHGARILSSYKFEHGDVWVITEWDRSVTTILLPEDY